MNRIKYLREQKGISQEQLGVIIGKTGQAVGQYESGKRDLSTDILLKLASYFDVSIDYLLGISDDKTRLTAQMLPLASDEAGKQIRDFIEKNEIDLAIECQKMGITSKDLEILSDEDKKEIKRFVEFIRSKYGKED